MKLKIEINNITAEKLNVLATHAEMNPEEYVNNLIVKRYYQVYGEL